MKALELTLSSVIALLIVLFGLATFPGGAYVQTLVLAILGTALVYRSRAFRQRLGRRYALTARVFLILELIVLKAACSAGAFPDILREIVAPGHQIGFENARDVNRFIAGFLEQMVLPGTVKNVLLQSA